MKLMHSITDTAARQTVGGQRFYTNGLGQPVFEKGDAIRIPLYLFCVHCVIFCGKEYHGCGVKRGKSALIHF